MPPRRKPPASDSLSASDRLDLDRFRVEEKIRDGLKEGLKAPFQELSDKLDEIKEQVTLTNGRVTALEIWKARHLGIAGAVSAAVGIFGWLISQGLSFIK